MQMQWVGLRELQMAVKRNPQKVLDEGRKFLTRGLAALKSSIIRSPWGIMSSGGGAPVKTGNLRDTHLTQVSGLSAYIGPNTSVAPYARYVHHGTKNMRGRPWLEYARTTKEGEIQNLYRAMLKEITRDLAR